jgi:hypothetical protein
VLGCEDRVNAGRNGGPSAPEAITHPRRPTRAEIVAQTLFYQWVPRIGHRVKAREPAAQKRNGPLPGRFLFFLRIAACRNRQSPAAFVPMPPNTP